MTVKNRATLLADLATAINDNTTGDVTPADVRGILTDIIDSLTLTSENDPWANMPIGVPIPLNGNITGVSEPPTNQSYRYIKLTAGLTGAGAYNNGVLTSESVSGSSPTVTATAVVSLSGSPINGQTIRLLNSEERFLRGGTSAGSVQDSANISHTHTGTTGNQSANHTHSGTTGTNSADHTHAYSFTDDADNAAGTHPNSSTATASAQNINTGVNSVDHTHTFTTGNNSVSHTHSFTTAADGGTEARSRNMSVLYFMRVK